MPAELTIHLLEAFNNSEVSYCHWKDNTCLAEALSGTADLDLLVARKSLSQTVNVLLSLGFKPAIPRWGRTKPGISHYYGFDPQIRQLIHVHLYSRVLTGERYLGSHAFPFESMLLDSANGGDPIKVVSKSAELVVFVLSVVIAYGSLLDLVYHPKRIAEIRSELAWLLADGDTSNALRLVRRHCSVMDEDLFLRCIEAIKKDSTFIERILISRRVRRSLRVFSRFTAVDRIVAYLELLWNQVQQRLAGSRKNKALCAGGTIVAFVGPDGSGKSTLVSASENWLSENFTVKTVHAGRPPSSFLTVPINIVLRLARVLRPRLRLIQLPGDGISTNSTPSQLRAKKSVSLVYAIRALSLAWDRRCILIKARRWAANGDIVLCDRYPSETLGAPDSRRLQESTTEGGLFIAIYNSLVRLERQLYRQIPPPDIVLQLRVTLETARRRESERIKDGRGQPDDRVDRHHRNQLWQRPDAGQIYDIDTEGPIAVTIRNVKNALWEAL